MAPAELLAHLTTLGRRFVALGMHSHAAQLRKLYRQVATGHPQGTTWDEEFALDWMGYLRLPPFETRFEVRDRTAGCDHCGAPVTSVRGVIVRCVFPGGYSLICLACQKVWITLN